MLTSLIIFSIKYHNNNEVKLKGSKKVVFEGMGSIKCENYDELSEKINNLYKNEKPRLMIEVESGFKGLEKPSIEIASEEVDEMQKRQRLLLKEYHTNNNQQMISKLNLSAMGIKYGYDSYAPYIYVEFNSNITAKDLSDIYKLAECDDVSKIYVKCNKKIKDELSYSIGQIDATQIIENNKSSGKGVVVGILDSGVVNESNDNLRDADIVVRDELLYMEPVTDHATQVASIIHAVAPGAKLLSVSAFGELSGEIQWLLDNDVDIINISYTDVDGSLDEEYGAYTSSSAYCDYISRNAWVTFVCSAGNEGDRSKMVTPPNGYNSVTVGACSGLTGKVTYFSSYDEKFEINYPNIVAPGTGIIVPTYTKTIQGTSFSAPLVSGVVAVLMQRSSILKSCPESVLSILMASAQRIDAYAVSSGFHDKAGTGMLNAQNAVNTINNTVRFSMSSNDVGSYISTKTVYLKAGQRIRIAFVSIVNNNYTTSTNLVTDYDLHLCNSAGSKVAISAGTHNNEFVDYYVTTSGYYTMKIKQYAAKKTTQTDYCSYSYYIQ